MQCRATKSSEAGNEQPPKQPPDWRSDRANPSVRGKDTVSPGATILCVADSGELSFRSFKTAWFTKAARKAHITDEELCSAISQIVRGQVDDLGGGVYKKRLGKNQYRSIILARAGTFWVYEYLFAKQNRANIDDDELVEFRKLARAYGSLTPKQVNLLVRDQDWMEICNGNQA